MKSLTITKCLFWIAFTAFLATSLPHVAWLYHLFEPGNNLVWWVLSYGIAASIDVMLAWLSWSHATSTKRAGKGVTVSFIMALAILSWYANYLYVLDHLPYQTISVWTIDLGFGLSTGLITPIIVSAIPLFVIGYTYMLGQLNTTKGETLEEKATRLESEKKFKDRIRQSQKGRIIHLIGDTITLVRKEVSSFSQPQNSLKEVTRENKHFIIMNSDIPENREKLERDVNPRYIPDDTRKFLLDKAGYSCQMCGSTDADLEIDHILPVSKGGKAHLDNLQVLCFSCNSIKSDHILNDEEYEIREPEEIQFLGEAKTLSVKEIKARYNLSTRLIHNCIKDGRLKTSPRNRDLVLIHSLEPFLNARRAKKILIPKQPETSLYGKTEDEIQAEYKTSQTPITTK